VLTEESGRSIVVHRVGGVYCDGDRVMLRQAVISLVDNAIKYSRDDIHIDVRTSDAQAILEVSDSGPGIDPERGAHIFDRFYRAEPDGLRTGLGLGLSISKWAVEANRGTIGWSPKPGGGSVFRITLPRPDMDLRTPESERRRALESQEALFA
jgi:two-component system OmpR family sensor kinase